MQTISDYGTAPFIVEGHASDELSLELVGFAVFLVPIEDGLPAGAMLIQTVSDFDQEQEVEGSKVFGRPFDWKLEEYV